jgi:PBP1b-binding outer membrane lipoprotein LpoB
MKKLLVIAIAAFAFTACNNTAKEGETMNADSTAAEATPVTPEATPAPEAAPVAPEATPAPAHK